MWADSTCTPAGRPSRTPTRAGPCDSPDVNQRSMDGIFPRRADTTAPRSTSWAGARGWCGAGGSGAGQRGRALGQRRGLGRGAVVRRGRRRVLQDVDVPGDDELEIALGRGRTTTARLL